MISCVLQSFDSCRDLEAAAELFEGEDSFHTAQVPGAARELQRFIGHINAQTGALGRAHLDACSEVERFLLV